MAAFNAALCLSLIVSCSVSDFYQYIDKRIERL